MKDQDLSREDEERYIRPIEEGILVDLPKLAEYKEHLNNNGLRLRHYQDISSKVAPTWDVCLDIAREVCLDLAKDRTLWRLANDHSKEFVSFLKSFKAMRDGFKSGAFRYALMISEKR